MTTDQLEKRIFELLGPSGTCKETQAALHKLLNQFCGTNIIVTANYLHTASEHMELELTEEELEDVSLCLCEGDDGGHEGNIYAEVADAIQECRPNWKART